jgi:hypothetical protein
MRYAIEIGKVILQSEEPITPERRKEVMAHLRSGYSRELLLDNIIRIEDADDAE